LHTAQLMPLPLTVSCFTKIQIGVTFLVPVHLGSPGKRAVKRARARARACVRVCVSFAALTNYLDLGSSGSEYTVPCFSDAVLVL